MYCKKKIKKIIKIKKNKKKDRKKENNNKLAYIQIKCQASTFFKIMQFLCTDLIFSSVLRIKFTFISQHATCIYCIICNWRKQENRWSNTIYFFWSSKFTVVPSLENQESGVMNESIINSVLLKYFLIMFWRLWENRDYWSCRNVKSQRRVKYVLGRTKL